MENADRVQNFQAGCRARGWRKNWRPTSHLSMAGSNQRNPRTDRLAWGAPANDCPAITAQPQRFENQGSRAEKSNMNMLQRTNTPRSASRNGRDPGNTIILEGFFPAFPKANSGVYSIPNRSARFSNSPRQPDANVRPRRGTKALSPRWLSEPGQLQWMSATTGTKIPIARRCRESVCPET